MASVEQKAAQQVRASKYERINHMTITQMQNAKKIINKKINDKNIESNTIQGKLHDMYAEYERSEAHINRYYKKVYGNEKTRHLVNGKRHTLTIAQIKGGRYKEGKREELKYGLKDIVADALTSRVALGVGVSLLGVGVAGQIVKKLTGQGLWELFKKLVSAMIKNNPAAAMAMFAGAALIAVNKGIPMLQQASLNHKKRLIAINQANNDMTNELEAGQDQFDIDLLNENNFGKKGANGKDNKNILVTSMYNNPQQVLESLGIQGYDKVDAENLPFIIAEIANCNNLTQSQKDNLVQVVKDTATRTAESEKNAKVEQPEKDENQNGDNNGQTQGVVEAGLQLADLMAEIEHHKGIVPTDSTKLVEAIKTVRPDISPEEANDLAQQIIKTKEAAAQRNASKGVKGPQQGSQKGDN